MRRVDVFDIHTTTDILTESPILSGAGKSLITDFLFVWITVGVRY